MMDWISLLMSFAPGFIGAFAILLLDLLFKRSSHRSAASGIVAVISLPTATGSRPRRCWLLGDRS
jgi:hypothetical protein